ncbi:MAG: 3-carboxy-cis,cis-muconate cycloisomerase [Gaiellaceae bacterium]
MLSEIAVPEELREAVSAAAWLRAMLESERALANAEALAGVIPIEAAGQIAEACREELFDFAELAAEGRAAGNPAEPLVRALRQVVGGEASGYVHWGATSQDVMDSAAMLVAREAIDLILEQLDRVAEACAVLTRTHRSAPLAARTLLQQAVPTSFGVKAAGWLVGVLEARGVLADLRERRLAAQLGGAAGTLAPLGDRGLEVLRLYAQELELTEPVLPWHTERTRICELGNALAVAAGALAKIGLDVVLLAQTEIGEVAEGGGGGGSSTMPQKRNPVGSTLAIACARLVNGYAGVLVASLSQEQERAAGAWHAEWDALSGALAYAGGAAAAMADVLEGLQVDETRMRANLDLGGGSIMAERLSFELADRLGRATAQEIVSAAVARTHAGGRSLREELLGDERMTMGPDELDAAFDPTGYLGSAEQLVDRALRLYEQLRSERSGE